MSNSKNVKIDAECYANLRGVAEDVLGKEYHWQAIMRYFASDREALYDFVTAYESEIREHISYGKGVSNE